MSEIIRTRESRYRDDYSSDDDSYSRSKGGGYSTVQRYKVTPGRVERVDDDRRPVRSERLEVDRRVERVDRIERDSDRPRSRSFVERDNYREVDREKDRQVSRTVVYDRDRHGDRELVARGWERDSDRTDRTWDRERDTDLRIERRTRDTPYEVETYKRETEYYTRPDTYIARREDRREDQREDRGSDRGRYPDAALLPVPVILPRGGRSFEESRELVRPDEAVYYQRKEVRDVGPRRDEVARYDRRDDRRDSSSDGYGSDRSDTRTRRTSTRERERSHSPHHKLHLAEGALAGAGAAAILARHRSKSGRPQNTATQVASGAALGAIGAQLVTRARSHIRDKSRNRSRSRSTSRSSHSKLKTGLGAAALVVAAAVAGKYLNDHHNAKKEELARGRSRNRSTDRRFSTDDEGANIRNRSRSRVATIAKAGVASAAAAGIVEAIRSKSQSRKGERSHSRLKTGGAIAASGIAGAALAGIYEARKAKKEEKVEVERGRDARSRSQSRPGSVYSERAVDPEMGLVEYGNTQNPFYQEREAYTHHYDPAIAAPPSPQGYDFRDRSRSRSRSRIRNLAGAGLAAGAAAVGVDQYRRRKERKAAEREERRRYEEENSADNYYANESYDDGYSPSPPRASGGAFYPENHFPPAAPPAGYTQHTTTTTTQHADPLHNPYTPPEFAPPVDAHGYPVNPLPVDAHGFPVNPPPVDAHGYPPAPPGTREGDNVSATTSHPTIQVAPPAAQVTDDEEDRVIPPQSPPHSPTPTGSSTLEPPHKHSVSFAPLSPTSSRNLAQIKTRHRRNSDPSSDRPTLSRHRSSSHSPTRESGNDDEVEVLPDRFDSDGRPLERARGGESEIVERIARDVGEVLEGRASWRDLLMGVLDDASGVAAGAGAGGNHHADNTARRRR